MKLLKGDNVKVLSGKDRGKTGKILSVSRSDASALVEGINLFKKHRRPRRQGEKGEVVTVPRPLHIGKIALICGSCGKATRVGMRIEGDKKSRYCKKCGSII
jgi:large subunit ribosomal protein L24